MHQTKSLQNCQVYNFMSAIVYGLRLVVLSHWNGVRVLVAEFSVRLERLQCLFSTAIVYGLRCLTFNQLNGVRVPVAVFDAVDVLDEHSFGPIGVVETCLLVEQVPRVRFSHWTLSFCLCCKLGA